MFTLIFILLLVYFILSFMASIIIIYKFFCRDDSLDDIERSKKKLVERK